MKFQPYLEGEKIIAITDHAALIWSKTFQNVNRKLLSWGPIFAAYPDLHIVHRVGRVHSNVDPISRLHRRVPFFHSPLPPDEVHATIYRPEVLSDMPEGMSPGLESRIIALGQQSKEDSKPPDEIYSVGTKLV